jgi:DNA-binding MurR/RpiR family transcriptional regulator
MRKHVDIEMLRARMKQRAADITPQLEKAAAVLFAKPDDVALLSMRELAGRAGLPPGTFLRLARVLGFSGYPELRNVFAERLRQSSSVYSPRAAQLQRKDGENTEIGLVKKLFSSKLENIERTFDRNPPQTLLEIVGLLEKAQRVFLVGQRSSYPIVYFFHYVLELFSEKSVAIHDIGGTFADELRYLRPRDLLFVVSFRPYTRTSILAAEYAASLGCPIIAMTDSEVSPLNLRAAHTIFVDPSSPSFFDSIVEPLIVIEALLALLMARGGRTAITNLRNSEDQLSRFGAYWATAFTRKRR